MIGERLAEIREEHGDTQVSLAQKLYVSHFTVSSWEQEKSSPSHEMLVKICKLYEVSSDYLLGLTRVDRLHIQKQSGKLTSEELEEVQAYSEYLLWKRRSGSKK